MSSAIVVCCFVVIRSVRWRLALAALLASLLLSGTGLVLLASEIAAHAIAEELARELAAIEEAETYDHTTSIGLPNATRRTTLVDNVANAVRWCHKTAPGAKIIVVGHSLGSVIASHALCSMASEESCLQRTSLVTMGSPLNYLNWFMEFSGFSG